MKCETQAAIGSLGARYGLSEHQRSQLARILNMLAQDEQAPTSVRDPDRAVDVHLADSLVALEVDVVRGACRIVDIGAGAGFPGLPLAVALPGSEVTLLDSRARKCSFIDRVRGDAGIENADVVCTRVEEWLEGVGAHDLAVVRGLAPQAVVLEYAAPLLQSGGAVVDWRGRREPDEERSAAAAAEELGLELNAILHMEPFEGVRDHNLHVYLKVRETPDRFPRRAGIARKRPLAG